VGLPAGSHHELGALAFATAIKRRGLNVHYLGANLPETSWNAAVTSRSARAAVIAVVTADDRRSAATTAQRLSATNPDLLVGSGGAFGAHLTPGAHTLSGTIGEAAKELDSLLHDEGPGNGEQTWSADPPRAHELGPPRAAAEIWLAAPPGFAALAISIHAASSQRS
jgi:hypothetical protein